MMSSRCIVRTIKDPIHDSIDITERMAVFIDTPQFQRLRFVKQLGASYLVWPGASHNRFEHCLGVSYLARRLVTNLRNNQPELQITDRDIECVELAGLCHDLGHGPWSHVWDGLFMPTARPDRPWKHEEGSEMMLDYLIATNNIDISEIDKNFIKDLIAGEPRHDQDEKRFLFDIVANKRNGLDVDRLDYLIRDSHMTGDPVKIDLRRLLESSARVIDDQICYDDKDGANVFFIFDTRFKSFQKIYHHKTAIGLEYMIIDALLAAEPVLKLSEWVFDPKRFTLLSDEIMSYIEMRAEEPGMEALKPARDIFARIKTRDIYKMVEMKYIVWERKDFFKRRVTPAQILLMMHENVNNSNVHPTLVKEGDADSSTRESHPPIDLADLNESDIIVSISAAHYGMQYEDPMKHVKFYSKGNRNAAYNLKPGDYCSSIEPKNYGACAIRVYTKDSRFFYEVQAGFHAVYQKIVEEYDLEFMVSESPSTPPVAEVPLIPQADSGSQPLRRSPSAILFEPNPRFAAGPNSPSQTHKRRSSGMADVSPGGKKRRTL